MNKIVSNFYLIRLDGEPVYIGYTNRTIEKRFSEHKHNKDFGDIIPTVERLDSLEYSFTWDMKLINSYAREVSNRETELILKYDTKNTIWQKGTSGSLGGQTWANVKSFVRTNRNNPTFREMNESDIIALLEWQRISARKLQSMVNNTMIKGAQKLEHMTRDTKVKGAQKLHNMVKYTNVKGAQKLEHMTRDTKVKGAQKLQNMVRHTNVKGAQKLQNIVNVTDVKGVRKLKNMVNDSHIKGHTKIRGMIYNTKVKY